MSKLNSDTVVVSVVHPGVQAFIGDFLESLEMQTDKSFDVLLANDGLDSLEEHKKNRNLTICSINVNDTISGNRKRLIESALDKNYEKILFIDSDDIVESNRVEINRYLLEKFPFVVNDLDLVDNAGNINISRYFSKRFNENDKVSLDTVRNGNLLGMSNTAVLSECLKNSPAIKEGESPAYDWYLWSTLLNKKIDAVFTSKTATLYRIHPHNTAGFPQKLDKPGVRKGIEVKKQHYQLMSRLNPDFIGLADTFLTVAEQFSDDAWSRDYINAIKSNACESPLWWENIRPPTELGLR